MFQCYNKMKLGTNQRKFIVKKHNLCIFACILLQFRLICILQRSQENCSTIIEEFKEILVFCRDIISFIE